MRFRFPVLLFCLTTTLSAFAERNRSIEVPATGVETIVFNVEEGDFQVRGDPTATEVRMNVSIDRAWMFQPRSEKKTLERLVTVSGEGTTQLTIATDIRDSIFNLGRAQYPLDFEVVVPARARLILRDTSGKITLSDMQGDVQIHDTTGTLAVAGVGGRLEIEKESGDIRLADVTGPTTIRSQSGRIQAERLERLEIGRSAGDLVITDVAAAQIRNTEGNVRVSRVGGDLQIEDDSGDIQVEDVGGRVLIRDLSGQIRTARTGAVTVYDTSGDVTVEQAESLAVMDKESGKVVARGVQRVQTPSNIKLKSGGM
ncbi:MAG TPA: DUF4097 family beta strand repeat-containing protein [Terriglobales bacterium]|nr:DUF4097 family beta strand repeat-containing protein [Terriglobales bacterium]